MPGLFGLVRHSLPPPPDALPMLSELSYARAVVQERYQRDCVDMGCVHLGTGGQRALYESDAGAVLFFGYLTNPAVPPGADGSDPCAAARWIHQGYFSRGASVLQEMDGAFACAIWDAATQALVLATDRLGLRPIYYAEHAGTLRFASEVKALLTDPSLPRRLNRAAIADLFQSNFIMGDKTLLEDVHLLPAASVLRCQDGRVAVSPYWEIPFPQSYPRREDSYYDDLLFSTLRDAVERMMRPGIRYGLSLSGGLDSRWIAALLADARANVAAFTLDSPGSDDTPPARAVAEATCLKHYVWEMSPTLAAELGEAYAYTTDGMDSLWHMEEFPLTLRVGDYVDVSVGGFLGDGLFGYEINPVTARLRKQDTARYRRWRISAGHLSEPEVKQVFGEKAGAQLVEQGGASLKAAYAQSPGKFGFQAIQYYDLRQAERRYANIAQLAKLAFVDVYHPLADMEVVRAALQLPPAQLMFERAYRRAMAAHLPDMAAIPWTFTLTRPTISIPGLMLKKAVQMVLSRYLRNAGLARHPLLRPRRYYADHTAWSRTGLRPFLESTLLSPETEALDIFDMQGLRGLLQAHFDGSRPSTGFLGAALALALWARLFYLPSVPVRPVALDPTSWKKVPQ